MNKKHINMMKDDSKIIELYNTRQLRQKKLVQIVSNRLSISQSIIVQELSSLINKVTG